MAQHLGRQSPSCGRRTATYRAIRCVIGCARIGDRPRLAAKSAGPDLNDAHNNGGTRWHTDYHVLRDISPACGLPDDVLIDI
jgi:hypothetical protein